MKRYQFKIIVWLLCLSVYNQAFANGGLDVQLKKNYSKEYSCDNNTTVELSNRYGKVEIVKWDRPYVKVDVEIIVNASSKSKAQEKIDDISITINKNGNNVVAVTEIESSSSSWWSGWWGSDDDIKFEINYKVQMPSNLHSIIENKYGNIYLPDLKGKTSINLKYGSLLAGNIEDALLLNLSYGKASIGNVKSLNGNLSYSDYNGSKAEVAILTTKYSKVYLDNVNSLTGYSKYDTYKLGEVTNLNITGSYDDLEVNSVGNATLDLKYTGVEISTLSYKLKADLSYGSLLVENLKTSFKSMDVNTSYAPVKIYGMVPTAVDISGKYYDANLGSDFIQKQKEKVGSATVIKGFKLSQSTNATIKITTKYGDVIMK